MHLFATNPTLFGEILCKHFYLPLCKSREMSQREFSTKLTRTSSYLCRITHYDCMLVSIIALTCRGILVIPSERVTQSHEQTLHPRFNCITLPTSDLPHASRDQKTCRISNQEAACIHPSFSNCYWCVCQDQWETITESRTADRTTKHSV